MFHGFKSQYLVVEVSRETRDAELRPVKTNNVSRET